MSGLISFGNRRSMPGLLRNPVAVKELRTRMRGARAFWVLSVYVTVMSLAISVVYLSVRASSSAASFDPRTAGRAVFTVVLVLQVFIVLFLAPAFTASAIVGEKERQTYDILRTTSLAARSLVAGKLVSALAYLMLLIGAAVPLEGIAFLLGGLSAIELLVSQAVLIVGAIFYALLGLFFSSLMRSTISASIGTIAFVLVFTMGVPFATLMLVSFVGPFLFTSAPQPMLEAMLVYAGLLLASTNLPASIIVSELLLVEEGAVISTTLGLSSGTVWIISPWVLFLVLHSLMSLLLFWLTVRRVRRIANR